MGYYEYLKSSLKPLGIYDLNTGIGSSELEVQGMACDELFDQLELVEREMVLPTAESFGLEAYSAVFPYNPVAEEPGDRREALMSLMTVDWWSFTCEAILRAVSGCGLDVLVSEDSDSGIAVEFPGVRGIPNEFEALKTRIEMLLPCHVGVTYNYVYMLWHQLESLVLSWGALDAMALTWREFEILE